MADSLLEEPRKEYCKEVVKVLDSLIGTTVTLVTSQEEEYVGPLMAPADGSYRLKDAGVKYLTMNGGYVYPDQVFDMQKDDEGICIYAWN